MQTSRRDKIYILEGCDQLFLCDMITSSQIKFFSELFCLRDETYDSNTAVVIYFSMFASLIPLGYRGPDSMY